MGLPNADKIVAAYHAMHRNDVYEYPIVIADDLWEGDAEAVITSAGQRRRRSGRRRPGRRGHVGKGPVRDRGAGCRRAKIIVEDAVRCIGRGIAMTRLEILPERAHERVPLKGMRKMIAAKMHESLQTTAQLTHHSECRLDALKTRRAELKAEGSAVSVQDLLLLKVIETLQAHPASMPRWKKR